MKFLFTRNRHYTCIITLIFTVMAGKSFAHDPIFSIGPHVLFKEGLEVHASIYQAKNSDEKENEYTVEAKYGLTGDWVAGIELPYRTIDNDTNKLTGLGDVSIATKYRFWRKDALALQESAAVLFKIKLDTSTEPVASNTVDSLLGLTYGYESLTWYRWASIRYRFNNDSKQGSNIIDRGNRTFVDFVVGYRPSLNGYRESDMVYMLELNGEYAQRNKLNQASITNSGGNQWFVSPGFMWTLRNMAIKGGIQLPVYSDLNGNQQGSDYRFKLSIEWHL